MHFELPLPATRFDQRKADQRVDVGVKTDIPVFAFGPFVPLAKKRLRYSLLVEQAREQQQRNSRRRSSLDMLKRGLPGCDDGVRCLAIPATISHIFSSNYVQSRLLLLISSMYKGSCAGSFVEKKRPTAQVRVA